MIVFTLFILICMVLAIGMAIDTVRTEFTRIKLQNVTDAAVLAAADLDQTLPPRAVVEDYLTRAGIDPSTVDIQVSGGLDTRKVSAVSKVGVPTMFMDMIGITQLAAPAAGTASESVTELEIVLVLDNSGSMSNNSNFRLNLLKKAAQNFIDQVLENETAEGKVAISIVPFATQVNAGESLLKHFNASSEHSYSHCATFEEVDFKSTALTTGHAIARTAHFDPNSRATPPQAKNRVCRTDTSRQITPWSDNADLLKSQIRAMVGQGWTSIEIGTKWGAALLDPAARPVLSAMVDEGLVDEKFRGQPFDYDSSDETVNRMKYLIVMSDGANTKQWDIKDPYRSGPSSLYLNGTDFSHSQLSYYDAERNQYYRFGSNEWRSTPTGQSDAVRLTWTDVWAMMGVKYYTEELYARATQNSASAEYGRIVQQWSSNGKMLRTWDICGAAVDHGVLVFTIGMDTYGDGDKTLKDCASGPAYFYDVETSDDVTALDQAFTSIARTINQLRLTN